MTRIIDRSESGEHELGKHALAIGGGKQGIERIDVADGSLDISTAINIGLYGIGLGIPESLGQGQGDDHDDEQTPLQHQQTHTAGIGEAINQIFFDMLTATFTRLLGKTFPPFCDFLPTLFESLFHNTMKLTCLYAVGTNNRQRIDMTKTTVQTRVALNNERSRPRRVV